MVTTEPLGTLQEREMVVGVVESTATLGWPGTGITETDTHSIREYRVHITYKSTYIYLNQYSSLE